MKNFFKVLPLSTGSYRGWLLFLLFLFSCSGFNKLSNQNLAEWYDPDDNYLHPRFVVFHENNDTSVLYVEVPSFELLFKKDSDGEQTSELRITWSLFSSYDSKQMIDSSSVLYKNNNPSDESYLIYSMSFKTPGLLNYVLKVEVKDIFRNQSAITFVPVEKANRQSTQWFMLISEGVKIPLFRNHVEANETFNIYSNDTTVRKMFVRGYFRDFPLAAPPFAQNVPVKFNYAADSIFLTEVSPSTEIKLDKKGYYHFQYDTTIKQGFTVFRFDEDFPKVTDAFQLLEALRYVTTKEEYEKLLLSHDKKAAIDNYWSELAGNRDRAKILIRKYYTRVQDANKLFTSYLEGWKTDRGMIYTIFGPPSSVFRTSESEDWTYGNFNNVNSLTFTFEKIFNPFSNNDYILRRSDFYEDSWYRAVDRWREGVVIND